MTPGLPLKDAVRRYSIRSEHLVMRKSEPKKLVLHEFPGEDLGQIAEGETANSDSD